MSDTATLLAQKFIARRDVKAIQKSDGSWAPHTSTGKRDGDKIKWRMGDLAAHIEGRETFGHYLLDTEDHCKLFAFDIDFEKNHPNFAQDFVGTWTDDDGKVQEFDPRAAWLDRKHPSRQFAKISMMHMAATFMYAIHQEFGADVPTLAAYSGGKGVHVYGLMGRSPASEARMAADIVLEAIGDFEPARGGNFFRATDQSETNHFRNFTVEVFPKQDHLSGSDGYGNLMRMPLGKNKKNPKDPTFFIDMSKGFETMAPIDPVTALTTVWEPTARAAQAG